MENKEQKIHRFRDTVLIRVSRGLKDEVRGLSLEKHRTISKIVDEALQEYLLSVKSGRLASADFISVL